MEREFQTNVMDYFISEYRQGRTPHPCIACNDKIKFSRLMDRADALNAGFRGDRPLRSSPTVRGRLRAA